MTVTARVGLCLAGMVLGLTGFAAAARAADPLHGAYNGGIFSEVRLGALAHDVAFAGGKETGADLNGEVLFVSPLPDSFGADWPLWLQWVAHPRPHVGLDVNTAGQTSQLYAGLTWTATLFRDVLKPNDAIEFNYFFGPALNDGLRYTRRPDRKSLGSNVLFHLGFEVDYRITPAISLGIIYEHSSNAASVRENQGLNNIGMRLGYHF